LIVNSLIIGAAASWLMVLLLADMLELSSLPRIRWSEPPTSNNANLMLDDPPLMVRIHGLACFTDDAFVILQHPEKVHIATILKMKRIDGQIMTAL
jgi:hypothetical protein